MAEPIGAPPAAPGGRPGGGVLPKDPKSRRTVLALGAAAVLALIFLLQRGRGQAAAEDTPAALSQPQPSTFADNGEEVSALSGALTDSIGTLNEATQQLEAAIADFHDGGTVPPTSQPPKPTAKGAAQRQKEYAGGHGHTRDLKPKTKKKPKKTFSPTGRRVRDKAARGRGQRKVQDHQSRKAAHKRPGQPKLPPPHRSRRQRDRRRRRH